MFDQMFSEYYYLESPTKLSKGCNQILYTTVLHLDIAMCYKFEYFSLVQIY